MDQAFTFEVSGTGPDTIPPMRSACAGDQSDNPVVVDITGDHRVIADGVHLCKRRCTRRRSFARSAEYQVERFDYEGRKAYVRQVDSDISPTPSITPK
jgi:hypothetical protein